MERRNGIYYSDQRRPDARNRQRQGGFTLVEVLIGIVVTSILVLGLSGLWTTVNNQFLFLSIKQKAIFVLNGEMERLTALYRYTGFEGTERQVEYDVLSAAAPDNDDFSSNSEARWIYGGDPTSLNQMVVTAGGDFDCTITNGAANDTAQFNADCAARVLLDENGIGLDDDRNYVWIDQHRRLTGRLSWRKRNVSLNSSFPNANQPCWNNGGGGDCQELILYLHFPYRYTDTNNPDTDAGFGRRETLVLKTIVGRR